MPGTRIKKYREISGFSQAQMAEKLHITQSTYCRIEQKEENLTLRQLKEIAIILNVPVLHLLPDELIIPNSM
jgi:transcriptional regulator with XRE-family HTH domain